MAATSGLHHVALGVNDLAGMRDFYRDVAGFTQVLAAFEDVAPEAMHEVARNSELVFGGAVVSQPSGGVQLEFLRVTRPPPRALRKDPRYGDIGVGHLSLAVADLGAFHAVAKGRLAFCGAPRVAKSPGAQDRAFVFARDPEGNLVEFVQAQRGVGGVISIGVGVTDIDRSIGFYRAVLELTEPPRGPHEAFSGLVDEAAAGEGVRVRACSLATGPDAATLDLIEVSNPRGRSIPFAANWGDFGWLQVCFSCGDIGATTARLERAGAVLLCSPKPAGEGSFEETGAFVYARDPDGVPIEFLFLPQ